MSDTALDSRLQLLLQLVESITASPDLDQVLDRVVRSASSLVDGSRSTLWIVEGARLVARARFEPPRQSSVPSRSEFELGEGLAGHAALERRTLLIPDVLADSRTANPAYLEAEGLRACAAVPLISHGRLVGVLELLTSRAAKPSAAAGRPRSWPTSPAISPSSTISTRSSTASRGVPTRSAPRT